MYNEELKRQYIADRGYTNQETIRYWERLFRRTEEYEVNLGKDVSEFSRQEYIDMLGEMCAARSSSRSSLSTAYKTYIRWVGDKGHPINQDLLNVLQNDLVKEASQFDTIGFVKDATDLERKINEWKKKNHFTGKQMSSRELTIPAACWLAWSGLEFNDAITLSRSDVNLNARLINVKNYRTYKICDEAFDAIKQCVVNDTVWLVRKGGEAHEHERTDTSGRDLLLRGFKDLTLASFQNQINREGFSYRKIQLSGIFYEMYVMEKITGLKPNFRVLAWQRVEDSLRWSGKNGKINTQQIRDPNEVKIITRQELREDPSLETAFIKQKGFYTNIRSRFRNDYYMWKNAFHPED